GSGPCSAASTCRHCRRSSPAGRMTPACWRSCRPAWTRAARTASSTRSFTTGRPLRGRCRWCPGSACGAASASAFGACCRRPPVEGTAMRPTKTPDAALRQPAEIRYADQLAALQKNDPGPRPPGWRLSPRAVRTFVLGSDGKELPAGKKGGVVVNRKFYGDDQLIDRCVVTLLGTRGLLLVGEPGTAKSMLSELLAAAVSGVSTNTIQGTAGTTEDQIKYSWNYALLLAKGPGLEALVPSPLYTGLK